MARQVIYADIEPALDAIGLLARLQDGSAVRLPAHLRSEVEAMVRCEVDDLFEVASPERPDAAFTLAPGPRLLALIANLRALGFLSQT